MGDRQQLLDMGFDAARVDWALKATKNSGLLTALDHLENNSEKPIPSAEDLAEDEDEEMGGDVKVGAEAKSIKCSECQKIFKNPALASFHGEKSGHTQFEESTEEIKPLTEEEKKQRLQELREKMAAKRAVKSVEEIEENKKNEALRRKAGKDAGDAIESLQLKQANKEALERKREKEADAKARAAVKAQIEADKKARAEKTAREKALREGRVPDQPSGGFDVSGGARGNQGAAPVVAKAGADFAQTRLQVRLASGGQPLTKSFPSTSTLTEVEEWLASESLSINVGGSAVFSTRHPPKTFARNEFSRSLQELGLTPSAVLFVQQ